MFYSSTERHDEYFDTFYALTGMTTASKVSFIAQGMPIKVEWMLELLRHIEQRTWHHWIEAILRSLKGKSRCQFSEYETYGNYIANMYPEYIEINNNHWFRYGTALLGMPPSKKKLKSLSSLYDYVAFETWDVGLENELRAKGRYIFRYLRTVLMR